MTLSITASAQGQVVRLFAPEDLPTVVATLSTTCFPLVTERSEIERIHLAILHLSQNNLRRFHDEIENAKRDWRDCLINSGLGFGNWRAVLARRGIVPTVSKSN